MTSPAELRPGAAGVAVRLRTLVLLRWIAIAGQLSALVVASFMLELTLPLILCLGVVAVSVLVNFITMQALPGGHRPSEAMVRGYLAFDLVQLAALLALSGGLSNPFALLVVAPVTIAATALSDRSVTLLGALAIALVTCVAFVHLPLEMRDGTALRLSPVLEIGFWLAIVIGVVFLALYARRVSGEIRGMSDALAATQMALAREQKLTDLAGVVAAAAHELGTPLATIKLVSAEVLDELQDRPDLAHMAEDIALIRNQTDRCRDILQSMGRAGKEDLLLRQAPLETVLREAAEPHQSRGRLLDFDIAPAPGGEPRQPHVLRRPEVIHGLRNLIQNAVDFAQSHVWIEARWDAQNLTMRISDDGPGFSPAVLARIGEPFLPSSVEGRGNYKGMGLGLFIAKTLLERSGARLSFGNGSDPFLKPTERPERSGAVVTLVWPLDRITVPADAALGENRRIEP